MKLKKIIIPLIIITLFCSSCSLNNVQKNVSEQSTTSLEEYVPVIKRLGNNTQEDWAITALSLSEETKKVSSSSITVAVIDSGVNIEGDYILEGRNIIDNSDNVVDTVLHGTYVCSIIHKVSPNVRILPIKVMDDSNQQTDEIVAAAIKYAIDNGADIINISLCMEGINTDIQDLLMNAYSLGIPVICAAGNYGLTDLEFPANQESTISCIPRNINNIDEGFPTNPTKKSFSAPGLDILAEGQYLSGSSFATAYISGTVSLLKSKNPSITVDNIVSILASTASDGNYFSYGLINVDNAVNSIN